MADPVDQARRKLRADPKVTCHGYELLHQITGVASPETPSAGSVVLFEKVINCLGRIAQPMRCANPLEDRSELFGTRVGHGGLVTHPTEEGLINELPRIQVR